MGLIGRYCASANPNNQIPGNCGYTATGNAVQLYGLGKDFYRLDCQQALQLNNHGYLEYSNAQLGIVPPGGQRNAVWLTADQVLQLAAANNPDGAGKATEWMHSPMPINLFEAFVARTVFDRKYHNMLHIVVVNIDSQMNHHFHSGSTPGTHWFTAAWRIESEDKEASEVAKVAALEAEAVAEAESAHVAARVPEGALPDSHASCPAALCGAFLCNCHYSPGGHECCKDCDVDALDAYYASREPAAGSSLRRA